MLEVAAVIPTFRPVRRDLCELVEMLRPQVRHVLISDDGSPAPFDLTLAEIRASGIPVLRHRRNQGIARGLNDGLHTALEIGASWLLTVDQDSTITENLVQELLSTARHAPGAGAVGVETIADAGGVMTYPTRRRDGHLVTEEVIQTGTLWSVADLEAIGGFDESLGIDAVDAAACLRLRERGRLIVLAPGTRIDHRVGNSRHIHLLGRQVSATGHSPARRETMVRNRLSLAPAEFRQSPMHALRTLRRVGVNLALAATIEERRLASLAGGLRGLRGLRRRADRGSSDQDVA